MVASSTATGLAYRLADFAARVELDSVPDDVLDKARACVLHGLVVGAAGAETAFARVAWATVTPTSGPAAARVLIRGLRTAPGSAAYANGVLLHARVQEDTHGTTHLGTIVIPAALAVAEARGLSGRQFLESVMAGYQIGGAVARRFTPLSTARGFRASGVYGVLGAAAAAGRALGLSVDEMASALGFASAFAGGTTESFAAGTDEWHFENGVAAANGVLAAQIAAAGGTGAPSAFEGQAGYLRAVTGSSEYPEDLVTDLGRDWELHRVTFKPYPVCAFNQSPVTVALQARERYGLDPDAVESIVVDMNDYEANYPGMAHKGHFASIGQTQMSSAFCVALALVKGKVTYQGLLDFADRDVLSLSDRIDVRPNPARPAMTAGLSIRLRDGSIVEHGLEEEPGRFYNWGFSRETSLARQLGAETPFTPDRVEALIAEIQSLERAPDVVKLVDLLVADQT